MAHRTLSGPFVDDPACREIYVDSFEIRMDDAGVMRIDLCAQRWNPDNRKDRVGRRMLVARLAMSLPLGAALSGALGGLTLEKVDTSKSARD